MNSPQPKRPYLIVLLVWLLFGALIGSGVGYFVYVRKTPRYESAATVRIQYREPSQQRSRDGTDSDLIDESRVLVGRPMVAAAVDANHLEQLDEFRDATGKPNRERAIETLSQSGRLNASRIGGGPEATIYRIAYRGSNPDASPRVVQSIITAFEKTLPDVGDQQQWQQAVNLLTQSREQIDQRLDRLSNELRQIESELPALDDQGDLVSAAAVRWEVAQQELATHHATLLALRERLGSIEAMIEQEASAETIARELSLPIVKQIRQTGAASETLVDTNVDQVQHREQYLALKRQVEREIAPLQREMSRLLERFGRSHPTVVAVQRKIDAAKSKLGVTEEDVSPITKRSKQTLRTDDEQEQQAAIDSLVNILRKQIQEGETRTKRLLVALDDAAVEMTAQRRLLRNRRDLSDQIQQQKQFQTEVLERLETLSNVSPVSNVSISVLQPATRGIQVEPRLATHVTLGVVAGAISGTLLSLLVMLAMILGEMPHEERSRGEEDANGQTAASELGFS